MIADFRKLLVNLREIDHLLPPSNPAGNYTTREEIDIRSYYILTHAEFEHLIEIIAIEKINRIVTEFRTNSTPHLCLIAMIFTYLKDEEDIKQARKKGAIIDLVDFLRARYQGIVDKNNGIKSKNLTNVYSPLGMDIDQAFGTTLISDLNYLGERRGSYAHHALHLKQAEDPILARQRTKSIVIQMRKAIDYIEKY